ncbi:MAG: hypothetical protein NTW29_12430 [Bacteroidetes bacterium]|nr:hypothetical protein [Bacteroidota bacterium]
MKLILRFIILVLFCSAATHSRAQQNFFNVPSSDITAKHKIFIQQQFNVYNTTMASNSTLCMGLGKNYEIGLNVLGLTYDYSGKKLVSSKTSDEPVYPTYGFNVQKQFLASKKFSMTTGAQLLFNTKFTKTEWYGYLNGKLDLKNTKLIAGLYSGDNNYFGKESRFSSNIYAIGFQAGVEYELIKDRFSFQADFISGKTAVSNLIAGFACSLNPHWILSAGYQMANNRKLFSNGTVLEITFIQ